ncbi:MAG: PH domain-containing protein [Gemmatimonadales bacterium]|nr:MAG: PH domain-containing protein [Gemmatimonadales bacterium]
MAAPTAPAQAPARSPQETGGPLGEETPMERNEGEARPRGIHLPGVEEPLPPGETLLWSGQPELGATARHVFHLRALLVYWAVVAAAFLAWTAVEGASVGALAADLAWLAVVAGVGTAIVYGFAFMVRKTTLYAITDRRVVMKIGITLPAVLNLPYHTLGRVDLRSFPDGSGDVVLTPATGDRVGWLFLWPHNRPWRVRDPQPALRGVANAEQVGRWIADGVREARSAADSPDDLPDGDGT